MMFPWSQSAKEEQNWLDVINNQFGLLSEQNAYGIISSISQRNFVTHA